MQPKPPSTRLRAVPVIFAAALFLTSAWATDHETVLYNFGTNGNDGGGGTSLIRDAAGNLYGTTSNGGIYQCGIFGCGTVFELSPVAGGGWTEAVLHNFGDGTDGAQPNGLMMDAAGNFYGVTGSGGLYGGGIAYELSPSQGGGWTESVLYNFSRGGGYGNGSYSLIKDAAGNLYGTMFYGGTYGEGMVFQLSPNEGGEWTETVLHSFGNGSDAAYPEAGVIMDTAGNLYGTTYGGASIVSERYLSCLPGRAAAGLRPSCTALMAAMEVDRGRASSWTPRGIYMALRNREALTALPSVVEQYLKCRLTQGAIGQRRSCTVLTTCPTRNFP
jgi:uncharacterized repeat protein (TIGR03803 family)